MLKTNDANGLAEPSRSSMFAILGSGFGLYGYLPALIDGCGQRVVLPARYRSRFADKRELARYANDMQWELDDAAALDCADGAVLALRPSIQTEWIPQCLARPNIDYLILEKPLAQSPDVAARLFNDLIRSRIVVRIGYIFRYTPWGSRVLRAFGVTLENGPISFRWSFLAHHFIYDLRNWKRSNAAGGGAIRFYGIQVIALLAEIGYRDVILSRSFGTSPDEVEKWHAIFSGSGLPECEVVVDTRSPVSCFRVEQVSKFGVASDIVLVDLSDPFDSPGEVFGVGGLDRRVSALSRLCHSLFEKTINEYAWYDATIKLWRSVEENTRFEEV